MLGDTRIACVVLLMTAYAFGGELKIIANPSVKTDTISAKELRGVFLLQRRTLKDGSLVVPVLQKRGRAHMAFLREYLNRDGVELQTYYQGLAFTGKGSVPKEVSSDAEMVTYVAQTRGAIGYVTDSANIDGVKVLSTGSEEIGAARILVRRVDPHYPETLKQMRIGGIVKLEIVVSPKGAVETVTILGGNPILAEAAAEAVRKWVYETASSATRFTISVPFDPQR